MANNPLSGIGSYQQPVYQNNNNSYSQSYASYPQNNQDNVSQKEKINLLKAAILQAEIEPFEAGNYLITLKEVNGTTKKYEIYNSVTGEKNEIVRFHFDSWSDSSGASLKTLHGMIPKINENKTKDDLFTIIPEIIDKGRNERNPGSVQTFDQFQMLYNYGASLIDEKSKRTS